jgi:hypothetical protein
MFILKCILDLNIIYYDHDTNSDVVDINIFIQFVLLMIQSFSLQM